MGSKGSPTPAAEMMAGRNIQHHDWKRPCRRVGHVRSDNGSKVSADQKTRDVPKRDRKRGADGRSESSSVRWQDNTQERNMRGKHEVGMTIQRTGATGR